MVGVLERDKRHSNVLEEESPRTDMGWMVKEGGAQVGGDVQDMGRKVTQGPGKIGDLC
jgi:hypothetical protein